MNIGIWWRVAAVALGLAGLGAGSVAAFIRSLEAGPPSLIGAGLVLLLVGISGRLPTRLKMGDNEAAWEAVENFVERTVEAVPPGDRSNLIDALEDLAEIAPQAAAPGLSALAYEKVIMEMLAAAVERNSKVSGLRLSLRFGMLHVSIPAADDMAADIGNSTVTQAAMRVDALISGPDDGRVGVEIKAGRASAEAVRQLASWVNDADFGDRNVAVGLLITRDGLTGDAGLLALDLKPRLVHVVVRGPQDLGRLTRAVAEALSKRGGDMSG